MTNEQREAMEAAKDADAYYGNGSNEYNAGFESGYKAGAEAERERIITGIEELKLVYTGSPEFRVAFNQALRSAIAVVNEVKDEKGRT